jgi:F-type H+-transporting ATPase subunit alpha
MRRVAGKLRLELSQYRDLEAFAQFGSDLDPETQAALNRGERLVAMLNQNELKPWAMEDEVAAVYSGTAGFLDRIKVERISEFHSDMLAHLHAEQDDLMRKIADGEWDEEIEKALGDAIAQALDDFGPDFDEEGQPLEEGESDRVRSAGEKRDEEQGDEDETREQEAATA